MMTPISVPDSGIIPHAKLRPRPVSSRGFTLLEILLVMAIIAMASLILVPNMTGIESRTFGAQVREAQSLLNYARRLAVVSGQPSTASLFVNLPDEETVAEVARSSVGQWVGSESTEVLFRDSTEREVEVEELLEITFFPGGGSTGGTLLLTANSRAAMLVIDPFTGRVETEFVDAQ